MTRFQLKMIACSTMLIDHIAAVLIPHDLSVYMLCRIVGRLAFPIFAWLIAQGCIHTRNKQSYLTRLAIFALVSQFPYMLAFQFGLTDFNVGVTLLIGALAICSFEAFKSITFGWIISIILVLFAQFIIDCDYGGYGVMMIVFFYSFKDNFRSLVMAQCALCFVHYLLQGHFSGQCFSLLSLALIFQYNQQKGADSKWFFYGFYPVHLLMLGLLKLLI